MRVRALSFQAGYACRHSGACCTSSWPIPVEADRLERMRAAIASGALRPAHDGRAFRRDDAAADADADTLLEVVDDRCAFFDAHARRCRVHTALGHDALPLACRQFPRVVVTDPGGVSVVLSHYCPTAAALLEHEARVEIVENAAAFPATGEYVGLDATQSLPPLLRPDVLMDWESWWEFERLAVDLVGNSARPVDATLRQLAAIVEDVRAWSPGEEMLLHRVRAAFQEGHGPRRVENPRRDPSPSVVHRFLAAHAFANWTAHLGQGLRTWLRSIETAYTRVASGRDVRQADLELRHLANPETSARIWSAAEREPAR